MPESFSIQLEHTEIACLAWGQAHQPVILALHGWLDNAATYERLGPLLADQYRVIALDLPGHGLSSMRPAGVRYHLLDFVDDVLGVADALQLDEFLLMGHSMGAGIATCVAGAFPNRVRQLILLEGLGTQSSAAEQAAANVFNAVRDFKNQALKVKPVYANLEDAITARTSAFGGISRDAAHSLCARGTRPEGTGLTWRSDQRLKCASIIRLTDEMNAAFLSALSMPVLLVLGKDSFFAEADSFRRRIPLVPALKIEYLPGNHHLHLEPATCEAVGTTLKGFLR